MFDDDANPGTWLCECGTENSRLDGECCECGGSTEMTPEQMDAEARQRMSEITYRAGYEYACGYHD